MEARQAPSSEKGGGQGGAPASCKRHALPGRTWIFGLRLASCNPSPHAVFSRLPVGLCHVFHFLGWKLLLIGKFCTLFPQYSRWGNDAVCSSTVFHLFVKPCIFSRLSPSKYDSLLPGCPSEETLKLGDTTSSPSLRLSLPSRPYFTRRNRQLATHHNGALRTSSWLCSLANSVAVLQTPRWSSSPFPTLEWTSLLNSTPATISPGNTAPDDLLHFLQSKVRVPPTCTFQQPLPSCASLRDLQRSTGH